MSAKSNFLTFASLAFMMEGMNHTIHYTKEKRKYQPRPEPKKIIPKGCKEYKFNYGIGETFECIATSQKSADKKFQKFINKEK